VLAGAALFENNEHPRFTRLFAPRSDTEREKSDVGQLQAIETSIYELYSGPITVTFRREFDAPRLAQLQTDIGLAHETNTDSLSNWERAIGDIRDSLETLQASGDAPDFDAANSGHYYESAQELSARAVRQWTTVSAEVDSLMTELQRRYVSISAEERRLF
jgi:hypothetical protein